MKANTSKMYIELFLHQICTKSSLLEKVIGPQMNAIPYCKLNFLMLTVQPCDYNSEGKNYSRIFAGNNWSVTSTFQVNGIQLYCKHPKFQLTLYPYDCNSKLKIRLSLLPATIRDQLLQLQQNSYGFSSFIECNGSRK